MANHIDTSVPGAYPAHTYLFIDDLHIARQEGVEPVLNSPEKVPEPVMKPENRGRELKYTLPAVFSTMRKKSYSSYGITPTIPDFGMSTQVLSSLTDKRMPFPETAVNGSGPIWAWWSGGVTVITTSCRFLPLLEAVSSEVS